MAKVVNVKPGPEARTVVGRGRVILWERDPDHPQTDEFPDGGEFYMAEGDKPKKAALTGGVQAALRAGTLATSDDVPDAADPNAPTPVVTVKTDKDGNKVEDKK